MEEEMKQAIGSIFDSLIEDSNRKAESNPFYEFINQNKDWLDDPETANTMILFPFKNIIRRFVEKKYGSKNHIIKLIYTEWNFFESNVRELTTKFEGITCCADRSRRIIKSYIDFTLTGELPVWDSEKYSHPKVGSPAHWMHFIESLASLYYGNPDKYLFALKQLMDNK